MDSTTLDYADRDLVAVCYRRKKNSQGTYNREFVKSISKWKEGTWWHHKYHYTLDPEKALEQTVKQWDESRSLTGSSVTRGSHTICRASMKTVKVVTKKAEKRYEPVV
jgi:hypothetical protein